MFKFIFNLVLGYIIYVYAIKPFIQGIFNIDKNDDIRQPPPQSPRFTQKNSGKDEGYSDFEEIK
jgi:hypothetical protein